MRRRLVVLAGLAALVLATQTGADAAQPQLTIGVVYGDNVQVGPMSTTGVNGYTLLCPRGWRATGHGVGLGATELIFAYQTTDGRGYQFAFANSSPDTPYDANGTLTCARGFRGLRVSTATASSSAKRDAIQQWEQAHGR
jgi:hypothetical protein